MTKNDRWSRKDKMKGNLINQRYKIINEKADNMKVTGTITELHYHKALYIIFGEFFLANLINYFSIRLVVIVNVNYSVGVYWILEKLLEVNKIY